MVWTRARAAAAGSSLFALTFVVGLGLPVSLPPPPQVGAPTQLPLPQVAGPLHSITGAARHGLGAGSRGPATFYVSPTGGDSNRGTSPARPWRTVTRVDRAKLIPGDVVLFEGGQAFSDATLMPGQGFMVSGAAGRPIVFGSYGTGRAQLTRGIWLGTNAADPSGPSHLVFQDLALGPVQGFQGTGDYIKLIGLSISHLMAPQSHQETGVEAEGSHWVIEDNTISDTGDSGMLLGFDAGSAGDPAGGSDYVVSHNTVTRTGLDASLTYARHAIYLKVADATVSDNRLTYFHDDGISMRYRDAMVSHNYIAHGSIGIAWYQYDDRPGMTRLIANMIAYTSTAAIFVCGVAESCTRPIESFVVKHNLMRRTRGERLNLQPTSGTYQIQANSGL
ncbi:MAG: hypothetical protein ACTHMY_25280 [Solirubrobacteraceae bacterium]